MCRSSVVALAIAILLWVAGASPTIAARYRVPACHWGYSNNCEFLSYRQCIQLNIWAEFLYSCTPPSAAPTHGSRRARGWGGVAPEIGFTRSARDKAFS